MGSEAHPPLASHFQPTQRHNLTIMRSNPWFPLNAAAMATSYFDRARLSILAGGTTSKDGFFANFSVLVIMMQSAPS
jgi:hypothetical protein